jgi:outer membrane lipoprotein-sorting protein
MMCEKLKAFLDDELGAFGRLAMSAHLRLCGRCRLNAAEWQRLGRQIEQLEDEPVPPALSERVRADAQIAAASARTHGPSPAAQRSRREGVMTMKRTVIAVVFLGVLAGVAFWQLPGRRGDAALAAVAEAMAKVKSVHFVGWDPSHRPGGRDRREGWIEPRRARSVEGDVLDDFFDENRMVEIRSDSGLVRVTINPLPLDLANLLKEEQGFLRALPFMWPQAAQDALERHGERVTNSERRQLPDGRSVMIVDLTAGQRMRRLTVDEATNLVTRMEEYRRGALVGVIEHIEYNVDIPENAFEISIPKGATVVDNVSSPPEEPRQRGEAPTRFKAAEEYPILHVRDSRGGSCGSPFHIHLRFEVLGDDEVTITYVPKTNTYCVVGRVLALGMGLNRVVENAEFVAPRPPDVTAEQYEAEQARWHREMMRRMPPPEVQRQWDAKAKELKAAGARGLGSTGGMYSTGGIAFEVLNNQMIEIWYLPSRNEFYVMGKAMVHRGDFSRIVENGWIKVPGPAPKLPED